MKTPRTEKLLETLTPEARAVINEMLEIAYKLKLNMQVHSGYRSPKEQDDLFALGRTKPGKVVTNARGTPVPQSSHCYRLAVDTHFDNNKDGQAEWDFALYQKVWDACVAAGLDKKGLRWLGNAVSFKEGPHFEVTHGKDWRTLAAEAGYTVTAPAPAKQPEKKESTNAKPSTAAKPSKK